ncbi:alpha/beta hydrolase [Shewanella sp. 1_MG-2023]|uniref:alpha/beta fold hydrolase n=1 Tax=unclassified Shewanella TaxID=196818 RepID=UPI000C82162A|nr:MULTISPECIES: alpha/beta hydrolase [unclassified Shewanella]MDO6610961.1 alpha/beta hydrolase [Shewanella sp. 7_MG-2023]MDO6770188.1 alpha/beta hydrolase [Shewanella sp. 2_MG-2023]MDO6793329.1 alpha/beta hydrolase [Shewanella sp. 1_MG-2023]PMG80463.1 alpha/beta hydrolase [Shewanella sp. 10N.286.51.B7]
MNESIVKSQQYEDVDFQLAHIRLAAKRYGDKNKPILLALHGWLDNADSFVPLVNAFQQLNLFNDFQLIAIDWPGHGFSQHRPGHYPLHWIDYLYDLDELMTKLTKEQPVTIIGHSLGGIVAAAYNAAFPNKVTQLVLIEALAPLFESVKHSKERLTRSFKQHHRYNQAVLQQSKQQQSKQAQEPNRQLSIERAVNARHQLTGMDKQWCELIIKRNLEIKNQCYCWKSDPRLKLDSPYRLTFEQVDALMSVSDTPCLLILAEQGFKQLKLALPQATLWFNDLTDVQIEGDHHLHMGSADQVANTIRTFILN